MSRQNDLGVFKNNCGKPAGRTLEKYRRLTLP